MVPLAALALAPTARAGAILATGNDCGVSPSGFGTCSTSQASATGGNPNLNWIQMAGSGSVSGGGSLDFFASDSGSGSIPAGVVPVSWDFLVQNISTTVDWTFGFEIFTTNGSGSYSQSGSSSIDVEVNAASGLELPSGGVTGWEMWLDTSSEVGSYSVTIPSGGTLDLNPGATAAPEPSTILLTSLGGVALLLRRRKEKA